MSEEKESKPAGGSEDPKTDEGAAAAKEAAGDFMKNACAAWGKTAIETKIYLVAMAVMFLCSVLFSAISAYGIKGPTMASVGLWGFLIVVGGLGGIGLTIWSEMGQKKDSWIPITIASCAGAAALSFLYNLIVGGKGVAVFSPLGFWLPFVAAGIATAIAVMRIVKA